MRVAGKDYSVDLGAIGQIVTITYPSHVETRRTTPHPVLIVGCLE